MKRVIRFEGTKTAEFIAALPALGACQTLGAVVSWDETPSGWSATAMWPETASATPTVTTPATGWLARLGQAVGL